MFETILHFFESVLGSYPFLLTTIVIAFSVKAYLLSTLISRGNLTTNAKKTWFFLLMVLIGSMISDSAWALKLIEYFVPLAASNYYQIRIFWIRIAWGFAVIQYQSLALFLESLIDQQNRLNLRQKLFLSVSGVFCLYFFSLAFIHIDCYSPADRTTLECNMQQAFTIYGQFFLMLSSLFFATFKLRSTVIPRILKKQLKIFISALMIPHLVSDFVQFYPFGFFPTYIASSYAVVSISTLLLTYAIYYCSRKMMGLRFLNFQAHVQSHDKFSFIDNFKDVLEKLSHVTSVQELGHITQTFFKDAFHIPLRRTALFVRKLSAMEELNSAKLELSKVESQVETILNSQDHEINVFMQQSKIIIQDEVAFSNHYENSRVTNTFSTFLEEINADIFIPIYEKHKIIAYIIIDRDARTEFYSDIERDEMLVYASYLSNVSHLLQNRNLEALIHQEKELKEELYSKHQEINQYKESIRSFLKNNKQKEIGIIFYKNRRFIYGNQTAKEMLKININMQEGHPIVQALKHIARQVDEYKSSQTCFTKDSEGHKLVLCGVPNLEQNNVIISVYYPDITDIITKQIDHLKDPTKWDYLLYLETTQSGQLINQLIPGSGEQLLNFKINILKIALSKKAILLTMPEEDLVPTVELLHHISLRESLHILNLQGAEKNFDTAMKLFGINPIFGINTQGQPLLKKLDSVGTLFIQNIQLMGIETQEYLAEFIRYGYYRVFKSDQKISSNVRIICSTHQDLHSLVQEGKFSKELFNELRKTTLSMPSLLTLPEQELSELAEGFTEQALKQTSAFKNLLELTDREKLKLAHQRPISLQELKTKVQQALVQKSKKNEIYQETQFDPAYEITDPELVQAARLGKQALRDPKIMALLWSKFKNQNKIATFLGVNRSSVNRRCKDYNLL
jgi:transcriptional regulator of acetoin/glycerol metabolism